MSYIGQSPKASRLRLTPQSSDPVNPADGHLHYSDGTARAEGLWLYKDSTWIEVGTTLPTLSVRSVTSAGSALITDDVIVLSSTGFTLSLFTAVGNTGKVLTIVHNGTTGTNSYVIDPNSSETIGGNATYTMYVAGETIKIVSNGTNWTVLDRYVPKEDIELYLDAGAGHGSTNTKIRRFTNSRKNTLSTYATYADSATLGMSVTIVVPGLYAFEAADSEGASSEVYAITVNESGTMATNASSLSYAQGVRIRSANGTALETNMAGTIRLAAGDIVRFHDDGASNNTGAVSYFKMVRLGE